MNRNALGVVVALSVLLAGMLGVSSHAWAQTDDAEARVTLTMTDAAVADVAAKITAQTGVQVAVTEQTTAEVTVELENLELEAAVELVTKSFDGSWMRGYILEKQTPDPAYTAEQLIEMMRKMREEWMTSLSEEEMRELFSTLREAWQAQGEDEAANAQMQPGRGGMGGGPGGGMGGGPGGPGGMGGGPGGPGGMGGGPGGPGGMGGGRGGEGGGRGFGRGIEDPIRGLMFPLRAEKITLKLDEVSLKDALYAFMRTSGFIAAPEKDLDGTVTLDVVDAKLADVLDQIAECVDAEWRPIYILSEPRQLTQTEMEQRMEQRFNQRMGQLWEMSPEDRKDRIDRIVNMIGRMADRVQNMPEDRRARMQQMGPRMLSRLSQYSATLSPERRSELKPILKALGSAINQ